MKGHPEVIEALNGVLTAELTAINQYFVHAKMCENWGYTKLAARAREESIEEMRHADAVIARVLYLEGVPNMQRLNPVRVGESVPEQHRVDLDLELEAVRRLGEAIALCLRHGDHGSRDLLETILKDEEKAVDWLEARLAMIDKLGEERYLAEHI